MGGSLALPATVVLDDDPTGTQSARDVTVLLEWDVWELAERLRSGRTLFLQTNSRALDNEAAVALAHRIKDQLRSAAREAGTAVRVVLRGDSTLRGHVFPEIDVFADPEAVVVFAPAFPQGGRTTVGGRHLVRIDGRDVPADETEYAADPVFPFDTAELRTYVETRTWRRAIMVDLSEVRGGGFADALRAAPAGSVVVPDIVTDGDVLEVASGVRIAERSGRDVLVRCSAPVAAAIGGVFAPSLLAERDRPAGRRVLLVCGSHTSGASAQLERVEAGHGPAVVIDTDSALASPGAEGRRVAASARERLAAAGVVAVASARIRRSDHNTLDHGAAVMSAMISAVEDLRGEVDLVVAKGGITSADVARRGLGARRAEVVGQLLPGVSQWLLDLPSGARLPYVVVPGNVGGPETLESLVRMLWRGQP